MSIKTFKWMLWVVESAEHFQGKQELAEALRQAIEQEENDTRYSDIQLAEMILSDCGVSSENASLLNRVAARIEKHVDRALEQDADEWFEKVLWGEPDVYGDGNVYRGMRSKDSETKTLYTAPPRREWVELTQEDIDELYETHHNEYGYPLTLNGYERAIEAKLKEKNT